MKFFQYFVVKDYFACIFVKLKNFGEKKMKI